MLEVDAKKSLRDFDLEVSLRVKEGEILMLVGENGCGKTTVLNMVAGLISPGAGRIKLYGETIFDSTHQINIPPEKRNVGYVFQSYALFPHLSVYENVAFGLRARKMPRREIEKRVEKLLSASNLLEIRDVKTSNISGGQKQRVALVRALAMEPDLLLMDEPLAALDTRKQAAMRRELRSLVREQGIPSIIVTHDLRDVRGIGDRICLLERGKVVLSIGSKELSSSKGLLKEAFDL